ncbi:MAG: hypothetical protein HY849_02725 [Nitrosomonadales bacterium]|nr:hypothetical protein [Nitrosomonadales bacterium]
MKSSKLAMAAIVLWVATVAAFGWFFVRGNTAAGTDDRTAIVLAPQERDLILLEMRGLLIATHDILDGINQNNMQQVAQAARTVGMNSAADVNPVLMSKLPLPFKAQGMGVHHSMDDLAIAAESGQTAPELLKMLTGTLSSCVACHSAWQLKVADSSK